MNDNKKDIHPTSPKSLDEFYKRQNEYMSDGDYFLGFGDNMESEIQDFLNKKENSLIKRLFEQYNISFEDVFLRANQDGKIMLYPSVKLIEWFKGNYSAYFSEEFAKKLEEEINNSKYPDLKTILVQANFYDNINFELSNEENLKELVEFFSLSYDEIVFGLVNGKKTLKPRDISTLLKSIEANYNIELNDFSYDNNTSLEDVLVYIKKKINSKGSYTDISDDQEIVQKKDEDLKEKIDELYSKFSLDKQKDYTILPDLMMQATGSNNYVSSDIIPYGEYLASKHSDFYWNTDEYTMYVSILINRDISKMIASVKDAYNLSILLRAINRTLGFINSVKLRTKNSGVVALEDNIKELNVDKVMELVKTFDSIEVKKLEELIGNDTDAHYLGAYIMLQLQENYKVGVDKTEIDEFENVKPDDFNVNHSLIRDYLTSYITDMLYDDNNISIEKIISSLFSSDDSLFDVKSSMFDEDVIIENVYIFYKNKGYTRQDIEEIIENTIYIDTTGNILNDEVKESISKIFSVEPEDKLYDNLMFYYNICGVDAWSKLKDVIFDEFFKQVKKAELGTTRNFEELNSKFSEFISHTKTYLNKDFIEKLPEEIKGYYVSEPPVITKEKKKGKVFGIKKRFTPQTRFKITKRLYATLAGVGIMSFLFMTYGKFISPTDSAEDCIETFKRILNSDMLANIFGDVRTYFTSLAATVAGTIGYIVQDEKSSKTKTK